MTGEGRAPREHVTEAWLSLDATPDQFAAAMGFCQIGAPSCVHSGHCALDGECFRSERAAVLAACSRIREAAADQPADVRQAMMLAAKLLRQDADGPTARR